MILAVDFEFLFKIIHLCCYLVALFPSILLAMSIDYPKFIKARNNKVYYLIAFVIGICATYLVGEFIYNILTLFIL